MSAGELAPLGDCSQLTHLSSFLFDIRLIQNLLRSFFCVEHGWLWYIARISRIEMFDEFEKWHLIEVKDAYILHELNVARSGLELVTYPFQ